MSLTRRQMNVWGATAGRAALQGLSADGLRLDGCDGTCCAAIHPNARVKDYFRGRLRRLRRLRRRCRVCRKHLACFPPPFHKIPTVTAHMLAACWPKESEFPLKGPAGETGQGVYEGRGVYGE